MFDLLDKALGLLIVDTTLVELGGATVSFETPDKTFPPADLTIDLFLYETRENRELRDQVPIVEQRGRLSLRRRPPLRVDCAYLVTAWSKKANGPDKIAAEHQLLAQAFNWLSRFPEIPDQYLQAANLTGQIYAPPTLVAQMDAAKNVGEFWSALGISPRPFFNLIVTVTMDLDQVVQEFPVTTVLTTYRQAQSTASDLRITIGGTVRDRLRNPVSDAWVRLDPPGFTQVTDASGRFIFDNIGGGSGFALRARARGFAIDAELTNLDIPSFSGSYDLQFT